MSDDRWPRILETVALTELGLSIFASIGAAQGYNVALAFFTLYSAYTRVGRINALTFIMHFFTLIIDIVLCSLYGGGWSRAGGQYAFALAMVILNMFAKVVAMGVMFFIFNDLGGVVSFPSAAPIVHAAPSGYHNFSAVDEEEFNPTPESTYQGIKGKSGDKDGASAKVAV